MPIHAFQGSESIVTGTITTAAGAATSYVPAMCPGASLVSAQIVAAWTSGTLVAEGSVDGSTWVALAFVTPLTGAQSATLAPADASTAVYFIPCAGFAKVRVRATAISLGGKAGATVTLNVNPSMAGGGASGLALETGGNLATAATRLGTIATNTGPGAAATSNAETSLANTNATQLPAQAASVGVWVSAPLANTAAVYIGGSGVTTANGIELQPGDREFFPVANSNLLYARTGTATQSVRSLVV